MSFRISTAVLRSAAKRPAPTILLSNRGYHSPYAVLGDSPITAESGSAEQSISAAYEKHYDHPPEPVYRTPGLRTYVVSEPDAHTRHYQVPAGAYPISSHFNFTPTNTPDTGRLQYSSTAAEILAYGYTNTGAPKNPYGVGESSAVRHPTVPGGRGYGRLAFMDKQGTTAGTGKLADRNSPQDSSSAESSVKEKLRI